MAFSRSDICLSVMSFSDPSSTAAPTSSSLSFFTSFRVALSAVHCGSTLGGEIQILILALNPANQQISYKWSAKHKGHEQLSCAHHRTCWVRYNIAKNFKMAVNISQERNLILLMLPIYSTFNYISHLNLPRGVSWLPILADLYDLYLIIHKLDLLPFVCLADIGPQLTTNLSYRRENNKYMVIF